MKINKKRIFLLTVGFIPEAFEINVVVPGRSSDLRSSVVAFPLLVNSGI